MLKREVTATFIGSLVAAAFGLGVSVVFARSLGRDGQGLLALAGFIPGILSSFCSLGQDSVNATFGGLYKEQRSALFLQSLLVTAFTAVVSVPVICAYFFWLPINRGEFAQLQPEVIWISCLFAPAAVLAGTLSSLVRGVGRVTTSAAVQAVPSATTLVLALVFLVMLRQGLKVAVAVSVVGPLVGAGISLWILRDYATLRPSRLSWDLMKKSLIFGWQISVATLAMFLVYRINQGILGYMASTAEIGLFSIAVGLADRLRLVPGSLGQAFLPRLANELAARQGQVPAVFRYATLVSVGSMAGVGVAGIPAILVFYGWEYAGSIIPFLILLPGVAALGGASILSSDLMARGKPRYAMIGSWVSLTVVVVLNLVLIPFLGISGAALASTVTYLTTSLGLAMLFYRYESRVPLREMVPRWADCVYIWRGSWDMLWQMLKWVRRRGASQRPLPPQAPPPQVPPGEA